jgi:hypothetical protein
MKLHTAYAIAGFAVLLASSTPAQDNQGDQSRRHVEAIAEAGHQYRIQVNGTVDAENTRDPIVYSAWKQGFEPMRSVKLENTGDSDVVNPWIVVNGKRNWRTAKDIVDEALRTYGDPATMTDADKARALWEFLRRNRFHATTGDFEVRDPVKMFNVYGFALCGDNAPVLMDLWRVAGLKSRRGFPLGHCVAEAWYDGGWHMLDGDESIIFLDRDNRSVTSEEKVARDHDLSKRAYDGEDLPALYNYDGGRGGDYPSHIEHTMQFTLRPGESIEWKWGQGEKHHYAPNPALFLLHSCNLHEWGPNAWATLRNGRWSYAPPLRKPAGRRGVQATNVRWLERAKGPAVVPAKAGEPATLLWKIRAPYVIVGGRLKALMRCGEEDTCTVAVSRDGQTWNDIASKPGEIDASLDALFPSPGDPAYEYFVKAEFLAKRNPGAVGLESLSIENDLQMAPLAMPSLRLGVNTIAYTDETSEPHAVLATFDWVERSSWMPPLAPTAAVSPADGAGMEGTQVQFQWKDAQDAGGGKVADYHFELSDEPGMRWALSPAFDVQTKGVTSFALRSPGLLNPGQRYFWRVRAKSEQGAWGPWSKTWTFVAQGPAIPVNIRLEQRDPDAYTIVWEPGSGGRKPARYRVYASDEKGFSVSDQPYEVEVGNQKTRGLFPGKKKMTFPANFIAETDGTSYRVKPVRAFNRVVAVDAMGNRSGSSDFASAPRPYIYTEAPREAKAGVAFRYEAKTIRSIGDLGYRDFGPKESYQSAFWDADKPRFSIETEMPRCGNFSLPWLKIDPESGVLSGTPLPEHAGEYQVNIKVEAAGGVYVQSFPLTVRK